MIIDSSNYIDIPIYHFGNDDEELDILLYHFGNEKYGIPL